MWVNAIKGFQIQIHCSGCYGNYNPNHGFINQSLFDFCHSHLGDFCILRIFKAYLVKGAKLLKSRSFLVLSQPKASALVQCNPEHILGYSLLYFNLYGDLIIYKDQPFWFVYLVSGSCSFFKTYVPVHPEKHRSEQPAVLLRTTFMCALQHSVCFSLLARLPRHQTLMAKRQAQKKNARR